jgi:hypothetical protein
MKILVTVPCPSLTYSEFWQRILDWVNASSHKVRIAVERTPNRMDQSISACIVMARKERPAWWVRIDADVYPETPLDDMLALAEGNRAARYDVTGSPTLTESGVIQGAALRDADVNPQFPWEVKYVSGSCIWTPQAVYDALIPTGYYEDLTGKKMPFFIAIQRPGTTEDYDYCERVRERGFRVCADPRMLVRQYRRSNAIALPSFRRGMTVGRETSTLLSASGPAP